MSHSVKIRLYSAEWAGRPCTDGSRTSGLGHRSVLIIQMPRKGILGGYPKEAVDLSPS
jgi:hypothetical protein